MKKITTRKELFQHLVEGHVQAKSVHSDLRMLVGEKTFWFGWSSIIQGDDVTWSLFKDDDLLELKSHFGAMHRDTLMVRMGDVLRDAKGYVEEMWDAKTMSLRKPKPYNPKIFAGDGW